MLERMAGTRKDTVIVALGIEDTTSPPTKSDAPQQSKCISRSAVIEVIIGAIALSAIVAVLN